MIWVKIDVSQIGFYLRGVRRPLVRKEFGFKMAVSRKTQAQKQAMKKTSALKEAAMKVSAQSAIVKKAKHATVNRKSAAAKKAALKKADAGEGYYLRSCDQ